MSKVNLSIDFPVAPWKLIGRTNALQDRALRVWALHNWHPAVENSALESEGTGALRKLHQACFAHLRKLFGV